jgi:hypothetical protein
MQKVILIIFLGIILMGFLSPVFANAEEWKGLVRCGGEGEDPCTLCDFFLMLDRAIDFLIAPPGGIVFIVAALILVIGGVMFVVSTGEPEKIATAKKTMTNAVLGLIIIFAAWLFINLFYTVIGYKTEWGPWNEIKCSVIEAHIVQI